MAKEDYEIWLKRAESNFRLAKGGKLKGVVYEDLCFEAQQSAEKALKTLLIHFEDEFPKVHSFNILLERLQKYTAIPERIKKVLDLSDYAVQARYPGDYSPVTKTEYQKAISIAQSVLNWAKKVLKEEKKYYRQGQIK